MNLTSHDLRRINDAALRTHIENTKHRDENLDEFRARCWVEAFISITGGTLATVDKDTGATVICTLPEHRS